jgi:membrane protease YdiL (CAAX protease family)
LEMNKIVDLRRIWIFLAFAFGLAWTIDLVIYLTGGLAQLGVGTLAWMLLVITMAAPTLAHLLTRLITREGWQDVYLRPHFKHRWPFWLAAWVGTPLLVLLGAGLFFAIFSKFFDTSLTTVGQLLDQAATAAGRSVPLSPQLFIILQIIQTIVLAPLINGLATLGEEFGWRAYLLPRLMPLGGRKAMVLLGIIWGAWHWPLIVMGYNYGLDYPGAPWPGLLGMVWFTFVFGTFLGWLTLKAGSVWPAAIAHASINGIAAIGTFLAQGQPNLLLGPTPAGIVASIPFTVLAFWLLWQADVFAPKKFAPAQVPTPLPGHP